MSDTVRKRHAKKHANKGTKSPQAGADGIEIFSRSQAARRLGIGLRTLRLWQEKGRFVPAQRRRGVWLYTRQQLDEQLKEMPGELASIAFGHFEEGLSPVQLVIKLRCDPSSIASLHESYVRMTGAWTIAGPPGSRASWEATYRVGALTPEKLRRALELCASDPRLRGKLLGEPLKEPAELSGMALSPAELLSDTPEQIGQLK